MIVPQVSFGAYFQIPVTIANTALGEVTTPVTDYSLYGFTGANGKNITTFKGDYPSTAIQVAINTSGFALTYIFDNGKQMQGGLINEAGSTPAGFNYWVRVANYPTDNGDYAYFKAVKDAGGLWSVAPEIDGITATTLPASATYLNNPITFSGTYNNGQQGAYDQIVFDLSNTTQSFQSVIVKPTIPISQVGLEYDFSQNLPLEGNYTYNVRLWDSANATGTAWFAGNNFALATTTASSTPVFNAPALVCDTWDLACYIKKAFIWLLYPTESLVTSYDGFLTTIQSKPPIGYFTLLVGNLNGLNASSTPLVDVTIPAHLKTYFFNPFDTGIASILWFFFAINFYRRLKHITI